MQARTEELVRESGALASERDLCQAKLEIALSGGEGKSGGAGGNPKLAIVEKLSQELHHYKEEARILKSDGDGKDDGGGAVDASTGGPEVDAEEEESRVAQNQMKSTLRALEEKAQAIRAQSIKGIRLEELEKAKKVEKKLHAHTCARTHLRRVKQCTRTHTFPG